MAEGPETVSIIVPVLNESAAIAATLRPLQSWRSQAVEIIVVDGGSRDDTCTRALGLCDQILRSARGRAAQMNAGAAAASGSLLVFLHADTRLPQAAVGLLLAASRQICSEQPYFWGHFRLRLSGRAWPLRLIECSINMRSRLTRVATGDMVFCVSRTLFDHVGGFPDIALMEDVALSKCLRRLQVPCVLPATVESSSRRWESRGIWRTVLLMWRLRLAYFFGADPARLLERYYPAEQAPDRSSSDV